VSIISDNLTYYRLNLRGSGGRQATDIPATNVVDINPYVNIVHINIIILLLNLSGPYHI